MASGYLAVLLGFLCLNQKVRTWVNDELQQGSLKQLVDALEEFLQYYRKAGQAGTQDCDDSGVGYVGRLQGLVESLSEEAKSTTSR